MNTDALLKVLIPIQAMLLVSQGITGTIADVIPYRLYLFAHRMPGYLLIALVAVHVALNWDWVRSRYGKQTRD